MSATFTPADLIKGTILKQAIDFDAIKLANFDDLTPDELRAAYEEHEDKLGDLVYEFRDGEVETDLPTEYSGYSRHYNSESVAAKTFNGEWVGWTYWSGGGKHGEPWAVDWMGEAYMLSCTEREVTTTIREFTKL